MNLPRSLAIAAIAIAGTISSTCISMGGGMPWDDWRSDLHRDHILAGRIYDTKSETFISPDALVAALSAMDYVLLGEIHDNSDHHRLQAWIISGLTERGRRPTIVFEMIGADQAASLARYLTGENPTASGLGPAVGWEKRGWPSWPLYQPIAEAALGAGLEIAAGDAARQSIRDVGRQGLKALDADTRLRLNVDVPLREDLNKALTTEMIESHCNLLPEVAIGPMRLVQRTRDASIADAMLTGDGSNGAILIAGGGHVRTDRGVPWYLRRRAPDSTVATVMMMEVDPDNTSVRDGVPTDPSGKPATDFVWFTPGAERPDQCAELKKHFGKKKNSN